MARDVRGGIHFHSETGMDRIVPRQLPARVQGFVNRVAELARVGRSAMGSAGAGLCPVTVIVGTAGVGKTSLALQWAHAEVARFPDGQLYVNLHGYDPGEPMTAVAALERFLRALGVDPSLIPPEVETRAALFRSTLADRRVLVVLDNAATVDQVRPLLPASAGCAVLVTSRSELRGLRVREGASRVSVEVLAESEAVLLLQRAVADYRAPDDPGELAELARLCARLPLALRIAAERMASRPHLPVRALIYELRDESGLWDALSDDDPAQESAVRTVFTWSYRALPAQTARVFRLLGLHPGPEYSVPAVAALTGSSTAIARRQLDFLVGAHLVEQSGVDRYQFHDLLRAYAADQARIEDGEHERTGGLRRVVGWYLSTVMAAGKAMHTDSLALPAADLGGESVTPVVFADYAQARDWYEGERANLVGAVRAAGKAELDDLAWMLAAALLGIYEINNAFDDWFATSRCGLDAARRLGDRWGEAVLLESLGKACRQSHRLEPAAEYQGDALEIRTQIGDLVGQARSINALGLVHWRAGRHEQARVCFEDTRVRALSLRDRRLLAFALMNLGGNGVLTGRFGEAIGALREAVELLRQTGQAVYEANALQDLSAAQRGLGRPDAAVAPAEQAVRILSALENRVFLAEALLELAKVHRALGDAERALALYAEVTSVQRRLGDRSREAISLDETGEACRELGRVQQAAEFHRVAAAIHRELGDTVREAEALAHAADAQRLFAESDDSGAGTDDLSRREP